MSSIGVAFGAGRAAMEMRIKNEKNRHDYLSGHLDEIRKRGKDETLWVVETNSDCVFPVKKRYHVLGFGDVYKGRDEPVKDYMKRCFETKIGYNRKKRPIDFSEEEIFNLFDFYEKDGLLIANNGITLYFNEVQEELTKKESNELIFRPEVTDLNEIYTEMEIRTHPLRISYDHFSKEWIDTDNLKEVQIPDEIIFE